KFFFLLGFGVFGVFILWPLRVIGATTGSAAYAMFRRKVM
ncbi:hypothetical protein OHF12_27820, partial [Escherichia coli]|nr:hypothetical protein [Escherichia coli]